MIKHIIRAGLLMTAAVASVAAFAASPIELKMSHFLPSTHPIQRDFLEPWARELEARTNGQVKVQIFPAGSSFGHVAKQMDQARAGVVDIAHGLTGIPRGRLSRTSIIDLPFLVQTADAASKTLWKLYPDYLTDEYKGVKVLALHAHNAGLIHTRSKKVTSMEDLTGLRLRAPSFAISMMLEELGASPVGMPPTQVYENLEKGVIDGTVFPWEAVNGFKLYEPLNYHLDAKAYTTSFFFVMNERKYKALPADVRKVIDEMSGEVLVNKFGDWWNQWDQPGLDAAIRKGNEITPLTAEQRDKWRERLAPVIEKYLSILEEQGVQDAREIYQKAQAYVAELEGK